MQRFKILSAIALIGTCTTFAFAQDENVDGIDDNTMRKHRFGQRGPGLLRAAIGDQLTDEQKTELKAEMAALKEEGATREEVRAAFETRLGELGVEIPEEVAERLAEREAQRAQRQEVKEIVDQMKEEGATREEIRTALAEAGFEKPEGRRGGKARGHRGGFKGPRGGDAAPAADDATGAE